ncbi:MAG: hypothetical protein DRJ65_20695 [Acidobacteria bacterium]|nr:MAG: hypothetical protein DRJ65_20695 [Acidobacteriota bacterium]
MNINPAAPLVLGLLLAVALPSPAAQPPDARQKLEDLAPAMRGAASSTRRRILEDFRRDLDGEIVRFTGTIWSLGGVGLDQGRNDGPDVRSAIFSWEYQGILVRDEQVSDETPTSRVQSRLGGVDKATLIIVKSGIYQLYALTASPEIVDGLRQGATITVEAQITGLREDSLLGFVTSIRAEEVDAQCPYGHQLPAGHDFKFCPYCGEALK